MDLDFLIFALIAVVALGVPLVSFILSIVTFVRTGRIKSLELRIHQLEARLEQTGGAPNEAQQALTPPIVTAEVIDDFSVAASTEAPPAPKESIQWEQLIGQKAFGWIAVILSIFTAAFFLRYAYENNWIGPVGRVGIGVLAGSALMVAGYRYHRRSARISSQMLTACGVVVLYLSAYSAFGLYSLLPAEQAGVFLAVIIVLSMVCAVLYDANAIALVAVVGGLATPLLLPSERDLYIPFFAYLAGLNLGVLVVTLSRSWPVISSIALLGTHGLFWSWHAGNYHPEKWGWALAFQAAIYVLYLIQDFAGQYTRRIDNRWEGIARTLLNAAFWFGAFYVLMAEDYRAWMGIASVVMATVYAAVGRLLLAYRRDAMMELVTAIAISVGFVVLAIPLQADARWIALGWAATATALWWFRLRINSPALGALSFAIAIASVMRVVFIDLPSYPDEVLWPVMNRIALSSIGVAGCIAAAVFVARPCRHRLVSPARFFVEAAGLGAIVLLWLILTVDLYNFFFAMARIADESTNWRRVGQMSVSILWTVYASILLGLGFRFSQPALRWTAIVFFALTIGKVFVLDMSGLSEIYRILAFFVLAIFLGVAARVYQRAKPAANAETQQELH
ncbi:MAG: DUF2339 domain-containing protein [Planctomycetota bacterium]|nr:DUF2339 domain-containing protein [Planctomycetota bacterium]